MIIVIVIIIIMVIKIIIITIIVITINIFIVSYAKNSKQQVIKAHLAIIQFCNNNITLQEYELQKIYVLYNKYKN